MRALRIAIALGGCVPVFAGLAGVAMGAAMLGEAGASAGTDSHIRYLSGLLLGIGLGFWSCIPDLPRRTRRMRLLTAIVVAGGLGRLLGVVLQGWPDTPMSLALGMELVVTPLLCWWQGRVALEGALPPQTPPAGD